MRDYEITSDLKQSKFENLKFVQGDTGSKIIVNLFEDSQSVNLTNCTVLAKYKRSDGYVDNKSATVTDNTITVEVDETMTATAGVLKLIFEITYETTKKVSTFMLLADVAEGIGAKSTTGGGTGDIVVDVDLSNYYNKQEIDKKLDNIANEKVDVVEGMGLSSNDFTDAEKQKLEGLSNYVHPSSHDASMITEDATHRFVTDEEKTKWNNNTVTSIGTVNKLNGVKIGVLGDSVSAGNYYCYGDENANVKTWHEIIANHTGCTINNVSRGGSTLTTVKGDGYSFIDRYNSLDSDCDVILVFGGINDYAWAGGTELGNIGDTDTNNICGALKTLCEGLINKYPATPIGFILPYGFNEYKGSGTWKPYEDKIIEVLNYYGISYKNLRTDSIMNANIDFINSKYFRYNSADSTTGDKIHPNTTGHSIIAKPILSFIEDIYYDIYTTNISSEILATSISMRETLEITAGEESTLAVTFVPSTTTNKTLTWESSNTSVATVVDGVVTGVAEGNCNITATTTNGKTATCAITVGSKSTASYITDGLTNFWNPNGQEQQATSWTDEVGGKVATINGLNYTDEGFFDNKLSLRATLENATDSSTLKVPFEITDNCTFEIAMKPISLTNNTYIINNLLEIYESPNGGIGLRIGLGSNLEKFVPIKPLTDLPFLSIAFIKKGSTISVATNGVTSKTLTETVSNGQVEFKSGNANWKACNDDIYSIKVYNKALSDAELLQNYEYYKTLI